MKTFIRVIEYWVPNADRSLLEFGGGLFGTAHRFASISNNLCFGRGEGLIGQVWETGRPILLKRLEGSIFRRAAVAKSAGLTSAIALPIFKDGELSSVVVLYCGDDEEHAGAIELWANEPEASDSMALVDGYYGTTGDAFESTSRTMSFRKGNGLPGQAWQSQQPVFQRDMGRGNGFLRADGAMKVGINRGFAIPCSTLDGSHYIMAFLSALATPIARRIETWVPNATGSMLVRTLGFSEAQSMLDESEGVALTNNSKNPLVQAYTNGVPGVAEPMVTIPVAPQGRITSVMALHF